MKSQMKKYTGQGLGGSHAQEILSLRSWVVSRFWYVNVFSNLEAHVWDF